MTKETKERATQFWRTIRPFVLAALLPFGVWAFRTYDATNVSKRDFEAHLFTEALKRQSDSLHHLTDDRDTRYLICRQDFPRKQCLGPSLMQADQQRGAR